MSKVKISYSSSVKVDAGWRSISVVAIAEKVSEKRGKILEVLAIDGKAPTGYQSRTCANRQKFSADYIAGRELGAIKILSRCKIVE